MLKIYQITIFFRREMLVLECREGRFISHADASQIVM